jgi:hypothetical protein
LTRQLKGCPQGRFVGIYHILIKHIKDSSQPKITVLEIGDFLEIFFGFSKFLQFLFFRADKPTPLWYSNAGSKM